MTDLTPADPWPFVGMAGMACAFFLYAASLTFAPWWVVLLLMLAWVALLLVAIAWFTPHPRRVPAVAVVAVLFWVGAVALLA
ncbi:hypothetical protein [Nocardioides sp. SR21]|uniref:hypothetical protein n=1 Tax=Nocardioides sp. SR21 TaxID=2919501 RepID=UPI001FAAA905|nr:hypothetical protein [Nocardioides sp. SR21]